MQTKSTIGNGKIQRLTVIEIATAVPTPAGHKKIETLRDAIGGPENSYMNFKVYGAPYQGNLVVNVETNYDASEKAIREFLTALLFERLTSK
jgi:hypothetical protein